jgi:DNA polymerase-3 subunit delta
MTAMRNFSARKTLQIISKIREIDARSKGLDNVNTTSGDLLKELVTFIVS